MAWFCWIWWCKWQSTDIFSTGWVSWSSFSPIYHTAVILALFQKHLTWFRFCSIYKVFDLKNYSFLYSISDKDVQEIKIRFYFFVNLRRVASQMPVFHVCVLISSLFCLSTAQESCCLYSTELQAMFRWKYSQLKMERCWSLSITCCIATRRSTSLSSSMRNFLSNKRTRTCRFLM